MVALLGGVRKQTYFKTVQSYLGIFSNATLHMWLRRLSFPVFLTVSLVLLYNVQQRSVEVNKPTYLKYTEEVKERIRQSLRAGDHISSAAVLPFVNHKAIFKVAPGYKLGACQIEKAMSTMIASIMCYLYDTDNFVKANRTIRTEDYWTRFCKGRNELNSTDKLDQQIPANRTTIFIVRDPIERFISGYVNKCITELGMNPNVCYGCKSDLGCVIRGLYDELKAFSNGTLRKPTYTTFHFAPHSWSCDLKSRFEEYTFVKYGNGGEAKVKMANTFADIFQNQGVPQYKIDEIMDSLLGNNVHATRGRDDVSIAKQKIKENPEYMRLLMEMLGSDYDIFGFPRPF